jgi:hypothetical protein
MIKTMAAVCILALSTTGPLAATKSHYHAAMKMHKAHEAEAKSAGMDNNWFGFQDRSHTKGGNNDWFANHDADKPGVRHRPVANNNGINNNWFGGPTDNDMVGKKAPRQQNQRYQSRLVCSQ